MGSKSNLVPTLHAEHIPGNAFHMATVAGMPVQWQGATNRTSNRWNSSMVRAMR